MTARISKWGGGGGGEGGGGHKAVEREKRRREKGDQREFLNFFSPPFLSLSAYLKPCACVYGSSFSFLPPAARERERERRAEDAYAKGQQYKKQSEKARLTDPPLLLLPVRLSFLTAGVSFYSPQLNDPSYLLLRKKDLELLECSVCDTPLVTDSTARKGSFRKSLIQKFN